MRVIKSWAQTEDELRAHLTRPFIDEVEVTEAFRQRTRAIWGEWLSPEAVVERILNDVKQRGDAAVIEYASKLDGADLAPEDLWVSEAEWERAFDEAEPDLLKSLETACDNIARYHAQQKPKSWISVECDGIILGQKYTPRQSRIYVPGGVLLVSTVLMCAIPARVAGVGEIIMASPVGMDKMMNPHFDSRSPGRGDRVLKLGGAQAIAALAYGTESIPTVDKIVGPGNIYVTLAKKMVWAGGD